MCWNVGSCSSSSSSSSSLGVKDAHTGHVTALAWQQQQPQDDDEQPNIALSGGQDGCLRAWDSRQGRCIAQQALHAGSSGRGAVTAIMTGQSVQARLHDAGRRVCGVRASRCIRPCTHSLVRAVLVLRRPHRPVTSGASHWPLVVTAGADKTLRVCDPAAGYRPLHTLSLPDFPYSLTAMGGSSGLVACGCGDGSLHIVDAQQGTTLYALGAGRAALRCLTVLHGGGGTSRLVASGDDGCVACYSFA
jgi:WD40 repeat protein